MSREIEFRAWCKSKKMYFYWDWLSADHVSEMKLRLFHKILANKDPDFVLQQ